MCNQKNRDHYNEVNKMLESAENFKSSLKLINELIIEEPENGLLYYAKTFIMSNLGREHEIQDFLDKSVLLNDDKLNNDTYFVNSIGYYNLHYGSLDTAKKFLHLANKLDSTNKWAFCDLGVLYLFLEDTEKSLFYLKKAIELDSDFNVAKLWLSDAYSVSKNYKDIILLDKQIPSKYKDFSYYNHLADTYFINDDIKNAKINYLNSIRFKENAYAYFALGEINFINSKLDEALNNYNKAIDFDFMTGMYSIDFYANEAIGWIYYKKNNIEKAEHQFKSLINNYGDRIEAFESYTYFCLLEKKYGQARKLNYNSKMVQLCEQDGGVFHKVLDLLIKLVEEDYNPVDAAAECAILSYNTEDHFGEWVLKKYSMIKQKQLPNLNLKGIIMSNDSSFK